MKPKRGQIWVETDNRFTRHVRILKVAGSITFIETVIKGQHGWDRKLKSDFGRPMPRKTAPTTSRFNGKSGGYRYVEG
jgi:hypothetical protein